MTLKNFMKMHDGGVACVSIYEYNDGKKHQYCEEVYQEVIVDAEWFKKIAQRKVKRFCVIGGGMYKVELCIELKEE